MFADEHAADELFLIRDQLFVRNARRDYVRCLCVAHVARGDAGDDGVTIERIQGFRAWDARAIVREANRLACPRPSVTQERVCAVLAVATIAAGVALLCLRWSCARCVNAK